MLMLNGVERDYTVLRRSSADSSAVADGKVYLLHSKEGEALKDVSLEQFCFPLNFRMCSLIKTYFYFFVGPSW